MHRTVSLLVAVAVLLLPATTASAARAHKKTHVTVHKKHHLASRCRGEGFLPGYREACEARLRAEKWGPPRYWYGGPGFYRGQWNGGGFGPCWTSTPLGQMWNCGR
jgi:hypothetical protein